MIRYCTAFLKMITFAPGLGLQEPQRSSQQLLVSLLPGWSVIDSEDPWQGGVSWSGQGCFAVLELRQFCSTGTENSDCATAEMLVQPWAGTALGGARGWME